MVSAQISSTKISSTSFHSDIVAHSDASVWIILALQMHVMNLLSFDQILQNLIHIVVLNCDQAVGVKAMWNTSIVVEVYVNEKAEFIVY